jgi:gas vesicle protein
MNTAIWTFIGTLFGALLGASASILTTFINGKNASKMQSKSENFNRRQRFIEFQQENYLKLQETILDLLRLLNNAFLYKQEQKAPNIKWLDFYLDEKLDEDIRISFRNTTILIERIENDELRDLLKSMTKKFSDNLLLDSESETKMHLKKTTEESLLNLEKLGKELRKTFHAIE